jgi:hypothetical protein
MAQDLDRALLGLDDFARVEPPAWLDELVQQRVGTLLEQRRAARTPPPSDARGWAVQPSAAPETGLRRAEAWLYACGFLAYGAQVADGLARLIWRAMTG